MTDVGSKFDHQVSYALRDDLPQPMPDDIKRLPVSENGYPIPWFVPEVNGKRDPRFASAPNAKRALDGRLCWVCGRQLGKYMSFVLGPMCAVTRTTAEPPCHLACADYSLRACPFLNNPSFTRKTRPSDKELDVGQPGYGIHSNPGVCLLWTTTVFEIVKAEEYGYLLHVGDPCGEIVPYSRGKVCSKEELKTCFDGRIHLLQDLAEKEGPNAVQELNISIRDARYLLGIQ